MHKPTSSEYTSITIYYRIVGDKVEIMNVLGRQNRDKWL